MSVLLPNIQMLYTHFPVYISCILNVFTLCMACWPASQLVFKKPLKVKVTAFKGVHLNPDNCNHTLIAPKQIINPYRKEIENYVQQKPFGSFFMKCAACIAVAEEISQTLKVIDSSEIIGSATLSNKIIDLCNKGFKNYDLRQYNNINLITDRLRCTEHLNTNMDGGWTKKLREVCNLYTSYLDLENIGSEFVNETHLRKTICNGSGIFRDCQNVDVKDVITGVAELRDCVDCGCCGG